MLWCVHEAHARQPDSITASIVRKMQREARDSITSLDAPSWIDPRVAIHIMNDHSVKMFDIKHSLLLLRFQPLPFIGEYEHTVSYYTVFFEDGVWHVSKRMIESTPLIQERDRLGWFFVLGLIILLALLWMEMPKKKAERRDWIQYGNEVYGMKYLAALVLPCLYLARLYGLGMRPNVLLVISFLFWILLLVGIGLGIKHCMTKYRLAQKN